MKLLTALLFNFYVHTILVLLAAAVLMVAIQAIAPANARSLHSRMTVVALIVPPVGGHPHHPERLALR